MVGRLLHLSGVFVEVVPGVGVEVKPVEQQSAPLSPARVERGRVHWWRPTAPTSSTSPCPTTPGQTIEGFFLHTHGCPIASVLADCRDPQCPSSACAAAHCQAVSLNALWRPWCCEWSGRQKHGAHLHLFQITPDPGIAISSRRVPPVSKQLRGTP